MKQAFYNGNIITMNGNIIAQAILVENGLIKEVSSNEAILKLAGDNEKTDLHGSTVLPAFIDAHSHLSSYANSFLQVSLGEAVSYTDISAALNLFIKKNKIKPGEWILANGYDHNQLIEKAHPTKQFLDREFGEYPVVLQHKSGHFGVFNSAALSEINTEESSGTGYLEENDFVNAIKKVPLPEPLKLFEAYKQALKKYAAYGITTIQEGIMVSQMLPFYKMLLDNKALFLDVVGYPQISDCDMFYDTFPQCAEQYNQHFRLGGYKIILDGSPQGRTAWMKTPYVGSDDYFGVSTLSDDAVKDALIRAVRDHRQILAHCNGDAAAEQFLSCAQAIDNKSGFADIRPVMVHGQLVDVKQLNRVKDYGIIPSFFIAHCYYWGDTHIENFGYERAEKISPCKSALNRGIIFTFHQDTPVIEPNMFETIWCAVNRLTKNGVVLGADEKISVMDALRAVTINAAYQYGEEKEKGSIEKNKKADFIIVSANPLETDPKRINTISVEHTYKSGKMIV